VAATADGAEAWETMKSPDAPRLAILDWTMPEMDGIEVCNRIRALKTDRPPAPVYTVTRCIRRGSCVLGDVCLNNAVSLVKYKDN